MSTTPHTHVRFGAATALSPQSPYSDAGSLDSTKSTSTFQYVNSQLIAHGFTRSPGLSLEGLPFTESEKVVKCLLAMLGQISNDMSQSEQFGGKLRTLTYENERLSTMHQQTVQQIAAAERETNSQKSKLNAANKSLQASEAAHKATTQELQRLKSTLQTVRQTHVAELKRREKESERMVDRWTKLSDSQLKIGSAAAGIRFHSTLANAIAGTGEDGVLGKGDSMLEHALEEAELVRKELVEEIGGLKGVILASANELARAVHAARRKVEPVVVEAQFFTMTDLFPPTPLGLASENFKSLLETLREILKQLGRTVEGESIALPRRDPSVTPPEIRISSDILTPGSSLDNVLNCLESKEVESRISHEDRAKALVRRAANLDAENDESNDQNSNKSVNLKERKETVSLEQSRDVVCAKENRTRAASVEEDFNVIDDDSSLADEFGQVRDDVSTSSSQKKGNASRSPNKKSKAGNSSRSPMKTSFAVGKTRMRSASKKPLASTLKSSISLGQPPSNFVPSFETEVIPNTLSSGALLPVGSASQPLIVSSVFVLPPPSPMASIPPQPDLLSPIKQTAEASSSKIQIPTISPPDQVATDGPSEVRPAPIFPHSPHPFPVAKPRAKNMFHAYSPARPSPLSRILMLADSPANGLSLNRSGGATEHARSAGSVIDEGPASGSGIGATGVSYAVTPLEIELGIDEESSEENSPLREKNARMALALKNGKAKSFSKAVSKKDAKARTKSRGKVLRKSEKENANAVLGDADRIIATDAGVVKVKGRISPVFGVVGPTTAASTVSKKVNSNSKGGARRVPIGSADAAPIGPGWK